MRILLYVVLHVLYNVFVLCICCKKLRNKNDVLYFCVVFLYWICRVVFLCYIFCVVFLCYIFCVIFLLLYFCVKFLCYMCVLMANGPWSMSEL